MNFQTKVYVGNLPENCSLEAFRSLFEKHGKVVECDIVKNYGFVHFADGEDAKLAVDKLHDTKWDGVTLKVELSYSKVRHKPGMGNKSVCYRCGKAGHWSKDCPKGPSRATSSSWDNNSSNNFEKRGQSSRGNRGPSINTGTSGNSGGFWGLQKNDPFADLNANGYRLNNSAFRDSYRGLFSSSSSSPYYERNNNTNTNLSNAYSANNNSSSSYYHNNNSNNSGHRNDSTDMMGLSGGDRGDHSRNDDPCDSYPPPTRYRPYPNAYERRAPLPPLSRNTDTFIPSLLSSSPSLPHHHHHHHHYNNNNNHYHSSSSSTSHNNSSSSSDGNFHDRDSYARPTQPSEYHERRRGGHHPSFVCLPVDETNNRENNAFLYK